MRYTHFKGLTFKILLNKFLTIGLVVLLIFSMGWAFVGCESSASDKDGKYDVTIRVACDDGEKWVFTPDVDEIKIERDYDGQEHKYYIDAYQLSERPGWEDKWISPDVEGANVFNFDMLFTDINGKQNGKLRTVKEQGEYAIIVEANSTSTLWKYRSIILYVTVK